jgi:NADH:ubiquinone reductase (H+-translocating)
MDVPKLFSSLHVFSRQLPRRARLLSKRLFSSPSSPPSEPRVVILGSGWAGWNTTLHIKPQIPLTVVSPRNHFLFTPLLASSAVGTLEFRCIQEPVRTALSQNGKYIQAEATALNPDTKTLSCRTDFGDVFELQYDKLVISVGVQTNVSCLSVVSRVWCTRGVTIFMKRSRIV